MVAGQMTMVSRLHSQQKGKSIASGPRATWHHFSGAVVHQTQSEVVTSAVMPTDEPTVHLVIGDFQHRHIVAPEGC